MVRTPRRYTRFSGGPDPLAPPPDTRAALREIADDVMAGYSPQAALEEYLRRAGLDDLLRRALEQRGDLLDAHHLGQTLQDVAKLLDDAVLAERGQLARDAMMDDTDRALREMTLDNLPDSPAAAVSELSGYDWQSPDARTSFEQIKDLLGKEMLDQQFAGMKEALENATDADRTGVSEMLDDLNELLRTGKGFEQFMDAHGGHIPGDPGNLDELIDNLAERSAAAQRMLNSMTPEQRRELMELSRQAFGSEELQQQMAELGAHLRTRRPDLDWTGGETFSGDKGLGLGDGTGAIQRLGRIDTLTDQLGGPLGQLDLDLVRSLLGDGAAEQARGLGELARKLRTSGLLADDADGSLTLSPQALRQLGQSLLGEAADRISARPGARDSRLTGALGEPTGASRPWQFGDTAPWDTTRTLINSLRRTGGMHLSVEDIEVVETEARTRSAVALLVDTSFSMASEGRWLPMKRTALALHHLIATRFRGDELALIAFGRRAETMDIARLTALAPVHEQGTNLAHALHLAGEFFARHAALDPTLLIVTDGEPTAHLTETGEAYFQWPTHPLTLDTTVTGLDALTRRGASTTFFRLGDDPALTAFLRDMAARCGGTVVAPEVDDLGPAVVREYLSDRR